MRAILDTNVLVSALKSSLGASFRLIQLIQSRRVQPCLTVPLLIEYESVLKRPGLLPPSLHPADVDAFLDWYAFRAQHGAVYYLWRPHLPDPKDDLVLEAALATDARYLVTFNLRDFSDVADLGVVVLTPPQFIELVTP